MVKESKVMRFFHRIGCDRIAWSLRRLYVPVGRSALVLEVGSGGNPYYRANVLCDAYPVTQERSFVPLVTDRPTVMAKAENLPFKDDAFDFVITSHVLEHSDDPEAFLTEIQRVGKAGYIETPDAFMERLCAYKFHRLEVSDHDGILHIHKKTSPMPDPDLYHLELHKARWRVGEMLARNPFEFHVRHYWTKEKGIKYVIDNSEYGFDWDVPGKSGTVAPPSLTSKLKGAILVCIRWAFSPKRMVNLDELLK